MKTEHGQLLLPVPQTHKQRVWEGNPLQGRDGLAWRGREGHGGLGHGVLQNLLKLVLPSNLGACVW